MIDDYGHFLNINLFCNELRYDCYLMPTLQPFIYACTCNIASCILTIATCCASRISPPMSKNHMSVICQMHKHITHPLVYVAMLKLHKTSADGSDVTLLAGEGHSASSFGVLQLRVGVNTGIAYSAIQAIHYHCQFNCKDKNQNGNVCVRGLFVTCVSPLKREEIPFSSGW